MIHIDGADATNPPEPAWQARQQRRYIQCDEAAAGDKDPMDLLDCASIVRNDVQGKRTDRFVEGTVRKRQSRRVRFACFDVFPAMPRDPSTRNFKHGWCQVNACHAAPLRNHFAQAHQIQTGAGGKIEHALAGLNIQRAAGCSAKGQPDVRCVIRSGPGGERLPNYVEIRSCPALVWTGCS